MSGALKASFKHFLSSLLIVGALGFFIIAVWYPWPYYELLNVSKLIFLMLVVDVVCGPLLTFIVWNSGKSRKEKNFDLSVIVLLQISAACYGLNTAANGRPVYLVYEVDRMIVVTASEIDYNELPKAEAHFQRLSWTGPRVIGTRAPANSDEKLKSIELSMAGLEPSLRPGWWQDYSKSVPDAISRSMAISDLKPSAMDSRAIFEKELGGLKHARDEIRWLPMVSSKGANWVVLINKNSGLPIGYINVNGFDLI